MFPLSTVLFPHAPLGLHVFEPRYRSLLADCLAGDRTFGVVLISRGSEVGGGDQRVATGTVAHIEATQELGDGRWALAARGTDRIKVLSFVAEEPYPQAMVDDIGDDSPEPDDDALTLAGATVERARVLLSELGQDTGAASPADSENTTAKAALWKLCDQAPLGVSDRQLLLEAADHDARLELLCRMCTELADDVGRYLGGRP